MRKEEKGLLGQEKKFLPFQLGTDGTANSGEKKGLTDGLIVEKWGGRELSILCVDWKQEPVRGGTQQWGGRTNLSTYGKG